MFTDAFMDALPDDPHEAARALCHEFYEYDSHMGEGDYSEEVYFSFIKAHAIFQTLVEH